MDEWGLCNTHKATIILRVNFASQKKGTDVCFFLKSLFICFGQQQVPFAVLDGFTTTSAWITCMAQQGLAHEEDNYLYDN